MIFKGSLSWVTYNPYSTSERDGTQNLDEMKKHGTKARMMIEV